jgi:endonuclease YncB( thermonuclease family)
MRTIALTGVLLLTGLGAAGAEDGKSTAAARDVTLDGVIRVYRVQEETKEVETGGTRLADIQVLPNGNLRSGRKTIQLYGISLPERKKLCFSAAGFRWTCGVSAFAGLHTIAQSQTIVCNALSESGDHLLAQCKVNRTDIAVAMLQEGWAELAAGVNEKSYAEAAASAKANHVGLWADGPPGGFDTSRRR